ncbi:type 1 fimbrial protein [Budviciaceae bacterium CWB-B4]|uniref:Type 1 fimbrial protein n=1 Tax=Limnobaculum xujianqingii TaxID=2738837 RepID=A0A9D7AFH5_9GAMM|nr:fimbrial protein [Limnobaculum xujianqingii]MBK5071720.1 type 1 fimbrial protein [Limnobaculum xujianqingii]MBK5175029.1 type 1 fimbrial protein [Limnobaculum xujianqingii]
MLKRVFLLNMLLSVLAVLSGPKVHAADVNITGRVTAAACTVSPILAAGQEVNLGSVGRTKFQNANDTGDWKSFTLNLTNCPTGTTKSTVTFNGTPDGTDNTLFANTEPSASAATNMAVQLAQDADHNVILSNNSTMTVNIDAGSATFPLAARLYTPLGTAGVGQVSSSVLVNFTYQ